MEAYRSGTVKRGGHPPKLHRVSRRMMTQAEAAEMLGMDVNAVRCYMSKHKAPLAQTSQYYEAKQRRRAEKDILNILMGG